MGLPLRLGVAYDFRNPSGSGIPTHELYRECVEQAARAEELGFDQVWFTEHHFVDDGYLPSWIPVAGAVLGRTTRIRVSTDIALLPFYNPVRLAEDLSVLDNLSAGRVELGVGMGYAPHEFKAFGIPISRRVSLTEEGLDILRLAWRDEAFTYRGKRWSFDEVRVTPAPVQPGGPPMWIAAMTAAGAERAARYETHFLPQGGRMDTLDRWRAAVRELGGDPDTKRVGIIRSFLVTDDRDRDWPRVRDAERYRMRAYDRFFAEAGTTFTRGATDPIPQTWWVGSAAKVYDEMAAFIEDYGFTDVCTWAAPPGMRPTEMDTNLERFALDVMPRLRATFG